MKSTNDAYKLYISISDKFHNKDRLGDKRVFSQSFQDKEINLDEFVKFIKSGFAFSYQYNNRQRSTKHFYRTNIIAIDIDSGYELEDLLNNETVQEYSLFIYTTASHTKDTPKFRVLFLTESPIVNANDIKSLNKGLTRLLNGDISATDSAHMFFGNDKADFYFNNKVLTNKRLKELITDGSVTVISDSINQNSIKAPTRSEHLLTPDDVFTTIDGEEKRLKDIKSKTTVFCTYHDDRNASAFIGFGGVGKKFLWCSKCQLARWEVGNRVTRFSTNNFESELLKLKETGYSSEELKQVKGLEEFTSGFIPTISNIEVQNNRYLNIEYLPTGLSFIKSPKGSGKTTVIGDLIQKQKRTNKKLRVLLIGHRRSLISHLCERFGLNNYLHIGSLESFIQITPSKTIKKPINENINKWKDVGVCLDSLLKVPTDEYDVVIIDEVEQVLNHFLSDTLANESVKIFNKFSLLLNKSKTVLCMDADLSWSSVLTISQLCSFTAHGITDKRDCYFVINTYKQNNIPITIHKDKQQLLGLLIEKLTMGSRIFFTSNSKTAVDDLYSFINKPKVKIRDKQIKIIKITSENSITEECQNFVKNIKTEILKYDVILTSPSMSTGIDITFPENESLVDYVFGYFENRINTHPEIDQQLSRVRNPKEIHIFISPHTYNFETNFEIVQSDYLLNRLKDVLLPTVDIRSGVDYSKTVSDYLYMCTLLAVLKRSSFNNLKQNFIEYKQFNKTPIVRKDTTEFKKIGEVVLIDGRKTTTTNYINNLIDAKPITIDEYTDYKQLIRSEDQIISDDQRHSMRRYELESFYRKTITEELIHLDDYSTTRDKVRLYESITTKDSKEINDELTTLLTQNKEPTYYKVMKHQLGIQVLLRNLIQLTPIIKRNKKDIYIFNKDIEFSKINLIEFVNYIKNNKQVIQTQFDIQMRKDFEKKPITQLNVFLEFMGLGVVKSKTVVINKEKSYFYKLDEKRLKRISSLAEDRNKEIDEKSRFYSENN